MKEKVLMLIIGILIGAIITAGGFLIYLKTNETNNQTIPNGPMDMRNFTPGERPEMDFENGDFPEPPELPDEENGDESGERQVQPDGENQNGNSLKQNRPERQNNKGEV